MGRGLGVRVLVCSGKLLVLLGSESFFFFASYRSFGLSLNCPQATPRRPT